MLTVYLNIPTIQFLIVLAAFFLCPCFKCLHAIRFLEFYKLKHFHNSTSLSVSPQVWIFSFDFPASMHKVHSIWLINNFANSDIFSLCHEDDGPRYYLFFFLSSLHFLGLSRGKFYFYYFFLIITKTSGNFI